MRNWPLLLCWLIVAGAVSAGEASAAERTCSDCHLPNLSEPIAAMTASVHWSADDPAAPINQGGCPACHGESAKHMAGPTRFQP